MLVITGVWSRYHIFSVRSGNRKQWAAIAITGMLTVFLNVLLFGQGYQRYTELNILTVYVILTIAAGIDFRKKIIPNVVIATGFVIRTALLFYEWYVYPGNIKAAFIDAAAGFAFGLLFLLLLSFLTRHGIGYGDVKLFSWLGFCLGFTDTYSILFYSALFAAIAGIWLLAVKKKNRRTELPFAPFVYAGGYLVMCMTFFGQ